MQPSRLSEFTKKLAILQGRKEALEENLASLDERILEGEAEKDLYNQSLILLNKAASASRRQVKELIENIVSHALQQIFQRDDYRFRLEFSRKRGQIEVKPLLDTNISQGNDPLEAHGGGAVDVITTVLRLILKHQLDIKGPLILDEPAKWIHELHRPFFMKMLQEYSERTGTQIIMISHLKEYIREAETAIEVTQVDGISKARNVQYT